MSKSKEEETLRELEERAADAWARAARWDTVGSESAAYDLRCEASQATRAAEAYRLRLEEEAEADEAGGVA